MSVLFFLLLLIVLLFAGGALIGGVAVLVWYAIVGLVIGALGRLLVRDTAGLGMLATILCGIAGALGGGVVANALDVGGVLEFIIAVLVAAVAVAIAGGSSRRSHRIG